jgi:hypothetical protein
MEMKALDAANSATAENAQAVRVLVDTLKWAAAKRQPRVYADRVDTNITGEVVHMTEDQRQSRIAALERKRIGRGEGPPTIDGTAEPGPDATD